MCVGGQNRRHSAALVETTAHPLAKASSTDDGMLSMSGVCR